MPSYRYERVSTPLLILKSRNIHMPHLVLTILLLSDLQTQILTPNLGSTRRIHRRRTSIQPLLLHRPPRLRTSILPLT
jgi:hypothetical protein